MRPPLPDYVALRAVADVMEYGSIANAATQTGVPRKTVEHRVSAARQRWPRLLPVATNKPRWAIARGSA